MEPKTAITMRAQRTTVATFFPFLLFLFPVAGASPAVAPLTIGPLAAQETSDAGEPAREDAAAEEAGEPFPPNTVVARFVLAPDALEGISTSGELVAALREHLALDLAMPLDEPLRVALRGFAGDPRGLAPVYHFLLGQLGVGYEGAEPLDDFPYATAVRESHGDDFPPDGDEWDEFGDDDWEEKAAWGALVKALDVGLPQSSDAFSRPLEPGALPLRVTAVHRVSALDHGFAESLEGALLRLEPSPFFSSSMDASWEEPAGFGYDVGALLIQLAPVEAEDAPADAAGGLSPEDAQLIEISASAIPGYFCQQTRVFEAERSVGAATLGTRALDGRAAWAVDEQGDLMLTLGRSAGAEGEEYCLAFISPGGAPEPGRYEVERLSPSGPPQASGSERPFVALFVSGSEDGTLAFVTESGLVEIEAVGPALEGRFELRGWTWQEGERADDVELRGSFRAVRSAN